MKKILLLTLLLASVNVFADAFDEDKDFKPNGVDEPIIYVPFTIKWIDSVKPDTIWLQQLQPHQVLRPPVLKYRSYRRFDEYPCEYNIAPGIPCVNPSPRIIYEEDLPEIPPPVVNVPEPEAIFMIMIGIAMLTFRKLKR